MACYSPLTYIADITLNGEGREEMYMMVNKICIRTNHLKTFNKTFGRNTRNHSWLGVWQGLPYFSSISISKKEASAVYYLRYVKCFPFPIYT